MNVFLIENVNKMRIYISRTFNLITLIFVYLTLLFKPIETLSENYVYQKQSIFNDEENSNISSCNLSLISIDNIFPCFGDNSGNITVQADSISAGYQYHYYLEIYESNFPLNGGWQPFGQFPLTGLYTSITTIPFTSLPADTFRVILEDTVNQCFDTIGYPQTNLIINEPPPIVNNVSIQFTTTSLTSDGSINISTSGGFNPYTYYWSGPNGFSSTNQNISNLFFGNYFLQITDSVGCVFYDTIVVESVQPCGIGSFSSVPPVCNGDANGKIIVNSVFGSPNFTYQLEVQDSLTLNWNNVINLVIADTFYTFNNLFSGVYRYSVTDSSSCSVMSPPINVQDPTLVTTNNNVIYSSTLTSCDGQINSIVNGGVAPITHFWTGPSGYVSNLPNISNLCVGTYCDSIVDDNGCNITVCEFLDFEPPCSPEIETNDIFCSDDSSGIAIVTKTNNSYPLFVWLNSIGDTLSLDTFALNLPEGNYTFNAYNLGVPNACPDTSISFSIITPEIEIYSLYGDTICQGSSTSFVLESENVDSSFVIRAIIDSDIFYFGDTSINYPSGIYPYIIEIDTGNGFISCISNQNIQVIENDLNIDSVLVTNEVCSTSLGSIEVLASTNFDPIIYDLNSNIQNNNTFIDLSEGYYNISITDNLNCSVYIDSILVDFSSNIVLEIDSSLETCMLDDGLINIFAQNGYGGYQYSVDSGVNYSSVIYSDTIIIDSLTVGNYYLMIKDDSSCVIDYGNILLARTPNPKIDSAVSINESCCGLDGQISVFSNPTNLTNIYSIDTFYTSQNSNVFNNLQRGSYLIYVQDTNTCKDSIEIYLEADSTPNINFVVGTTDVVCNGDSNGTLKVYYPDSCYIYELHRYTFFTPQLILDTGHYFNNLISGFYGVIAISNSGTCIDSSVVKFIDEPTPISFQSPSVNDIKCNVEDSCNGSVFLTNTPNGGVSPYYYYLKDIDENIPLGIMFSDDTVFSLCDATYQIQIVDANACVVSDTLIVSDSSLKIDSFYVQPISCYNGSNAIIEVNALGGIPNYTYLWSNFDSTKVIDNIDKGWYSVTITDSALCSVSDSVFIDHPDTLQFDIVGKKPETCMGSSYDGEIFLEITGGTPPYNHIWNSFSGFSGNLGSGFGDTIFNLTYDTIFIDVTDANFCNASPVWVTQSVTIVDALNAMNSLSFDSVLFPTEPLCYGSHSGFINVNLDGGDPPIQYSIDSMVSWSLVDTFSNLNAGKYTIYVMDNYGCLDSSTIEIYEHEEILINYDSIKNISCFNGNDGYLSVSVSGGVYPYEYLWIPTQETTSSVSNLLALPHIIRVSDSFSCVKLDTIDLVELTDPIQTQSEIVDIVSCFGGSNGVLTTNPIGGMPEYNYLWKNLQLDTVSVTQNATGLSSGTYLVYVSDSFNCGPAVDTIEMKESSEIIIDVINIFDNICSGDRLGELTFDVNGGIPNYTIYVSDEQSTIYSTYGNTISELPSSDYSVWVLDGNNCYSDTLNSIKLGEPGKIQILNNIKNLKCFQSNDGEMEFSMIGGTPPYNFILENGGDIIQQGQINQLDDVVIYDLNSNEYEIKVTDFNNCVVDSIFQVLEPEQIIADFTSALEIGREIFTFQAINTSIGGHLYFLDFGNDSSQTLTFLQEINMTYLNQGSYDIMMIAHDSLLGDACNDTLKKSINVEGYDVFNVFTPNNDGYNDVFHFNEWMLNGIYVEIFNRWGEKIFHWNDINQSWDGRGYNGREVEEGVYFYRMIATGIDGTHFEENGSITLLR